MRLEGPVLVATDLGASAEEAIRQGSQFAAAADVPLFVCHVLPETLRFDPLFPELRIADALSVPEIERRAGEAVAAQVESALGRPAADGSIIVDTGSPHASIVGQAERLLAGLVVTARGEPGSNAGVAERIVRHAPCPVLVARSSPAGPVLGATDFSDPALPAVAAALDEAIRRGVRASILHCIDLLPPAGVVGYEAPPVSAEVLTAMRGRWEERMRGALASFEQAGELVLEEGAAGPLIVKRARQLPASLVVVGTHGRTGLRRLLLGSVAEHVVRHAPCSVLVVRLGQA